MKSSKSTPCCTYCTHARNTPEYHSTRQFMLHTKSYFLCGILPFFQEYWLQKSMEKQISRKLLNSRLSKNPSTVLSDTVSIWYAVLLQFFYCQIESSYFAPFLLYCTHENCKNSFFSQSKFHRERKDVDFSIICDYFL